MNRHQVLTGAANSGDSCYAVGSVEGTHFTAYGTGTTVVILASDFQRVQIIPSPLNGSPLEVSGITCCSDLGKIAASYGSTVCIFEPTPLSNHTSSHRLDYHWYHTGTLDISGDVLALKWSLDGNRLLVSGDALEMWMSLEASVARNERRPSFFIEDDDRFPSTEQPEWTCVWKLVLANPATMIKFSSDGLLFATAGENDRLVKVWYEDRKELGKSENCNGTKNTSLSFNFVYLTHPRAVTGFNWRRTSKYMQRNTVANMLLTSCKDNICRIWCETVVPEDGLVDTQQLDPKDGGSPLMSHRNKKKIIQRIHQIRHALQRRKKLSVSQTQNVQGSRALVGTLSLPDVQRVGGSNHGNGIVPSFHFHLAASINLNSDVPLIGSLGNVKNETFNFVIHWLDNKEFQATLDAERLIDEMSHKPVVEQTAEEPLSAGVGSPTRQNGRRIGLPVITSDPAIAENAKRFSTPLQKTKSYITVFSGRWSTMSSDQTPEPDVSSKPEMFEQLEQKVERLVQSWHQGSDMLYGIHPLDGSLVMWVVDNLDESTPGNFTQVKVSLSAMLPNAFPVFDAVTMQPNVWLLDEYGRLGLKSLKLESELRLDVNGSQPQKLRYMANATGADSSGRSDNSLMPNVLMVSKHTNGSINLWQISFAESSQFSTVVNVSHVSRASGHRFRANSSACHPVLPLLLTTAHNKYTVSNFSKGNSLNSSGSSCDSDQTGAHPTGVNNCNCSSELILWRVAPIGPLSKSGGITELARINSSIPLAFSKVAWFPTLLPVSCLGIISNSPSALFVASDGVSLRIYQAVLDGRLILAEQQTRRRKPTLLRSFSNGSNQGDDISATEWIPRDSSLAWNVVSLQSTSRPGCIIDLKSIEYAIENWQNIQLIHVFQELLISGRKSSEPESSATSKTSDGESKGTFQERFYLVVVEKIADGSSVVHMWLIAVCSQDSSRKSYGDRSPRDHKTETKPPFTVTITKVCSQTLPLPNGVSVSTSAVAAGHLSSSSIYPACFAPYLFSTSCTDGKVHLWQCALAEDRAGKEVTYLWKEWKMMTAGPGTSAIGVEGKILSVSIAYSGRIAIAHQIDTNHSTSINCVSLPSAQPPSISRPLSNENFGLYVSVYECESTGGARWMLEDTVEIPCVVVADPKVDLDLSLIFDNNETNPAEVNPPRNSTPALFRLSTVPSASTVLRVRRYLSQQEPHLPVKLRPYLDWVSTEDGSHILTVSIGSKILLYSAASAESCPFVRWKNAFGKSFRVEKSYKMTVSSSEVHWVLLRTVELQTADGYPPLPKHLTWVRSGILVVGLENEMHVYSQWKFLDGDEKEDASSETGRSSVVNVSTCRCRALSKTMSGIKLNASIANLTLLASKQARRSNNAAVLKARTSKIECGYLTSTFNECGLFEAAQITNPCIPQYHPKQLLELLLSGRMFCVRSILSHLLTCLSVRPLDETKERASSESDAFSKSPLLDEPEEPEVNFLEVRSFPPLPLYVLLYADSQRNGNAADTAKVLNYDRLFSGEKFETASVSTDDDGGNDVFEVSFGPEQARLLARYLERSELPGLSSLDQINLMALTESLMKLTSDETGGTQNGRKKLIEIVDDCGLRFLFAALQHASLVATLPLSHREEVQRQGLSSEFYVWAFHSKNKLELLDALPWKQKDEVTWEELKQFGVGWWLHDSELLTHWIEKVAKTTFQATKDPVDVALYYIALRKKNVLAHLFRLQNDDAKCQFFKNDFTEDRWRKAALKNAFRLLGKQQFQKTAAFFLLAGSVSDAIKVCLMQMKDIQLALVILRLYEGGPLDGLNQSCKRLLYDEILGCDENGLKYDAAKVSRDPFLRSMAHWMLFDYKTAFDTLLISDEIVSTHDGECPWKTFTGPRTSIFNVYRYLRTHPKVVEKKYPQGKGFSSKEKSKTGAIHGISSAERQLYFRTAHSYFRAGCPLLSLEALMDMPPVLEIDESPGSSNHGTPLGENSVSANGLGSETMQADSFDWSQPVTRFDDDKLDLSFGLSSSEEDDDDEEVAPKPNGVEDESEQSTVVEQGSGAGTLDFMAQQLSFIACMKILVNELSTLATGFEVDGGQLRFQLYMWLEKEMEVLKSLCGTGSKEDLLDLETLSDEEEEESTDFRRSYSVGSGRKLHETILAEKSDFEAKMRRMARRRKWLKANEQVLSTLLGYSILHGSSASGLASMQMELMLLLQELQQTKTPQKLRSPIPFPTSLPLLSASVASAKTVIADPIRYLQSMQSDLLHSLIEFRSAPSIDAVTGKVYLLRDLSIALSACIYQCLCDSDSFVVSKMPDDVGLKGFTSTDVVFKDSYLMAGARRKDSVSPVAFQLPTSRPSMWPGVSSLVTLLKQKRDEDSPKLNILLLESLVAVSVSLLCYALAVYDAIVLYRLVAHPLEEKIWPLLFGGGQRKPIRVAVSSDAKPLKSDHNANIRSRLTRQVLGASAMNVSSEDDRSSYQEQFVSPITNMIAYFLAKVEKTEDPGVEYDSADSVTSDEDDEEEDEDDGDETYAGRNGNAFDADSRQESRDDFADDLVFRSQNSAQNKTRTRLREHVDPNSYSWCLMRYAVVRHTNQSFRTFLPKIGIDFTDLPMRSPLVHSIVKNLEIWEDQLQAQMEAFPGPPSGYIPGCSIDSSLGVNIMKYSALANPSHTPFLSTHYSALPAKRLWHFLVTRENLQGIFIRYVFGKGRSFNQMNSSGPFYNQGGEGTAIIYRDQETISCFSLIPSNRDCIIVASSKELVEMDIINILNPLSPSKGSRLSDIEIIPSSNEALNDFGNSRSSKLNRYSSITGSTTQNSGARSTSPDANGVASTENGGRGGNVLLRRPESGVKKVASHPTLPYYLTGSQDGILRLWEFGREEPIAEPRRASTPIPKPTRILFNSHGNKFGVSDTDGKVCLWQLGHNLSPGLPFLELKCHNKCANDFVFVGSSSLLATAGNSSDNLNVCLWDTLLPKSKSLIKGFQCSSDGCSALVYAPCHQAVISGGKKGELYIFDVRQRQLRHTFLAHNSAVKCIAFDPVQDCFATGSADGEIKVWDLTVHNLLYSFPGDRSKANRFRSSGVAVSEIYLSPTAQLFSSSAEGTLRVRHLTLKQSVVSVWPSDDLSVSTHF